jgi:hypothetical protein
MPTPLVNVTAPETGAASKGGGPSAVRRAASAIGTGIPSLDFSFSCLSILFGGVNRIA